MRPSDSPYDEIRINLSYEECQSEFDRIESWERFYDAAFANHPYIEMYYEDLVTDQRGQMARVFELLSLSKHELQSTLRKQNTRALKKVVENFREVRQRFADMPYAHFFTETGS